MSISIICEKIVGETTCFKMISWKPLKISVYGVLMMLHIWAENGNYLILTSPSYILFLKNVIRCFDKKTETHMYEKMKNCRWFWLQLAVITNSKDLRFFLHSLNSALIFTINKVASYQVIIVYIWIIANQNASKFYIFLYFAACYHSNGFHLMIFKSFIKQL